MSRLIASINSARLEMTEAAARSSRVKIRLIHPAKTPILNQKRTGEFWIDVLTLFSWQAHLCESWAKPWYTNQCATLETYANRLLRKSARIQVTPSATKLQNRASIVSPPFLIFQQLPPIFFLEYQLCFVKLHPKIRIFEYTILFYS